MAGRACYGVRQPFDSIYEGLIDYIRSDALRVFDVESVRMSKHGAYYQYAKLWN